MSQVKLRNPIGVFFLSLITGGIYYFYWFYRINEEAAIVNRDENANPGLSLLATTVGILLIVPPFWTHWTTAQRVGRATGSPPSVLTNVVLSVVLLPVAGLVYTWWLQGKMNRQGRLERMADRVATT